MSATHAGLELKMAPNELSDEEIKARRRKRSIAIALALGALVIVFYALTVVKMGPAILDRSL